MSGIPPDVQHALRFGMARFGRAVVSPSYIIFKVGGMTYARNGLTGRVDFGGTDAAEVIQRAVDALEGKGGVIHLKAGEYVVDRTIQLKSNIVLEGDGMGLTVLKSSPGNYSFGTFIDVDSQSNVVVRRLTLNKGYTEEGQFLADEWRNMSLSCENSEFIVVEEVEILHSPNYAMVFGGSKTGNISATPYYPCNNVIVRGCRIIDSHKDGVHFFGGRNIIVENNYFEHLIDDAIALGADVNYPISDVIVENNVVVDSAFKWTNGLKLHSGWLKLSVPGSGIFRNIVVRGNNFVEVAQQGFSISLENPDYPVSDMVRDIVIEGNVLKSIRLNSVSNAVVRGNKVVNDIIVTSKAFYIDVHVDVNNINIANNNAYRIMVGVGGGKVIRDIMISGNVVEFIDLPGYPGVIDGVIERVLVIGNRARSVEVNSPSRLVVVANNVLVPGSYNNVRVAGLPDKPPEDVIVAGNVAYGATFNNYIAGYESGARVARRVWFIGNIGYGAGNHVIANNPNCTEIYAMFNSGDKSIYVAGDLKLFRNPIYRTENSGVATITAGSTRVTVPHGLPRAPTKVLLTPYASIKVWVENITSTSFDIVADVAPATDVNVSWYAEV